MPNEGNIEVSGDVARMLSSVEGLLGGGDTDNVDDKDTGTEDDEGADDTTTPNDKSAEEADSEEESVKDDASTDDDDKGDDDKDDDSDEEGEEDLSDLEEENKILRESLEKVAQMVGTQQDVSAPPADDGGEVKPKESAKPDVSVPELKGDVIEFVRTEDEFNNALSSRDGLNKLLTGVFQSGRQSMLLEVPEIASSQVQESIEQAMTYFSFYTEHRDLKPFGGLVVQMVQQVQTKNPGWKKDQILEEAATKTRELLRMARGEKELSKGDKRRHKRREPALSSGRSSRKRVKSGKKELSKVAEDVLKMTGMSEEEFNEKLRS